MGTSNTRARRIDVELPRGEAGLIVGWRGEFTHLLAATAWASLNLRNQQKAPIHQNWTRPNNIKRHELEDTVRRRYHKQSAFSKSFNEVNDDIARAFNDSFTPDIISTPNGYGYAVQHSLKCANLPRVGKNSG
jgi:hypothetical protein